MNGSNPYDRAPAEPAAAGRLKATNRGLGCMIQSIGLALLVGGFIIDGPLGIAGALLGLAVILAGGIAARKWVCGACRNPIERASRLCPACKAPLK